MGQVWGLPVRLKVLAQRKRDGGNARGRQGAAVNVPLGGAGLDPLQGGRCQEGAVPFINAHFL